MGALLALSSAVVYGMVDFTGGLLSRRIHHTAVTFFGQLGGLLLACAAALLMPADAVHTTDLLWGALSGVGSGMAMRFLNRGLSRGAMSVVVPVSAVTGVALSVLCGVLVLGDRPGAVAWLGIAVTVPALWFVSGGGGGGGGGAGKGTADGLLASAGVAVQYLALGQAGPGSGLWPVAAGRVAAVLVLLPDAVRHARRLKLPPGRCVQALLIGAGAALGLVLYLLAAQRQLLAVAVVLASLYPALPVILGLVLLHERISRRQALGLLGAGVATVLLTLG
ncbi:DMT family transporter [Streptomyces swartbergensis]|uniref:Multidrug DMT transporter permease n=1 Tax=Streptomyces swartbergensis TaxID=487165 RepID=A0A243S259_9ACTN|nr:DMT family transporter [Streptomyces swartbergensis]OUD01610.1 multidrug DMT transporter permease [Streptomyces swartbergensis]